MLRWNCGDNMPLNAGLRRKGEEEESLESVRARLLRETFMARKEERLPTLRKTV
jgi:hypothetical protein